MNDPLITVKNGYQYYMGHVPYKIQKESVRTVEHCSKEELEELIQVLFARMVKAEKDYTRIRKDVLDVVDGVPYEDVEE